MRQFLTVLVLLSIFCAPSFSQKQVVDVPDYWDTGIEGTLNDAVQAAVNAGTLSNTIFKLKPYGYYIQTGEIVVPSGQTLEIIGEEPGNTQETAPPQILWKAVWLDFVPDTTRNYFFNCYGDLILKNIWVFYADSQGQQVGSCIIFQNDSLSAARRCSLEGVIIDYATFGAKSHGSVTVACKNFRGTFKNCYWKNCTDMHFRYYGRALSFPFNSTGFYGDTLIFENCTFANIGYVLMQENGEYFNYVKFNHCTFLNVAMYSLESGWWNKLSVTNCIFENTYMHGHIPILDAEPYGGTLRIDSLSHSYYGTVYSFPYEEQGRRILFTNSSYYIEQWLSDWMYNNPASVEWREAGEVSQIPVPQPMLGRGTLKFFDSTDSGRNKIFPFMNRANLYDSINPGFLIPPSDTERIKIWLYHKWFDSEDHPWAWKTENSINQKWPLEENLAYKNEILKTAGMGGFPLGDLYHWWPTEYQQWKAQEAAENDTINKWLYNGFNSAVIVNEHPRIPEKYILEQNYPNPFNPTTQIDYYIPQSGNISLKVFNLLGQEVMTLFKGFRNTGSYTVKFDGTGLGSGIYFYSLKAADFTETKKFVLIK